MECWNFKTRRINKWRLGVNFQLHSWYLRVGGHFWSLHAVGVQNICTELSPVSSLGSICRQWTVTMFPWSPKAHDSSAFSALGLLTGLPRPPAGSPDSPSLIPPLPPPSQPSSLSPVNVLWLIHHGSHLKSGNIYWMPNDYPRFSSLGANSTFSFSLISIIFPYLCQMKRCPSSSASTVPLSEPIPSTQETCPSLSKQSNGIGPLISPLVCVFSFPLYWLFSLSPKTFYHFSIP